MNTELRPPLRHALICRLASLWPVTATLPAAAVWLACGRDIRLCLAAAYLLNSLLTLLFYREDKYLATQHFWRIPEFVLHVWELLCGWPGALVAQNLFRHKRSKVGFMLVFAICAVANVAAAVCLFSPEAADSLLKVTEKAWSTLFR